MCRGNGEPTLRRPTCAVLRTPFRVLRTRRDSNVLIGRTPPLQLLRPIGTQGWGWNLIKGAREDRIISLDCHIVGWQRCISRSTCRTLEASDTSLTRRTPFEPSDWSTLWWSRDSSTHPLRCRFEYSSRQRRKASVSLRPKGWTLSMRVLPVGRLSRALIGPHCDGVETRQRILCDVDSSIHRGNVGKKACPCVLRVGRSRCESYLLDAFPGLWLVRTVIHF